MLTVQIIISVDIANYEANSEQTGKQMVSPAQPSVQLHWGHHEQFDHASSLML